MDKNERVIDFIKRLATTNSSTEDDSKIMQIILNKYGYSSAKVVSGIVYLEGHGTINSPPTSIHTIAKVLLKSQG